RTVAPRRALHAYRFQFAEVRSDDRRSWRVHRRVDRRIHHAVERGHRAVRVHLPGQQPFAARHGRRRRVRLTAAEDRAVMRRICAVSVLVVACAGVLIAQEGHPLVGTWYGDWGPSPQQRHDVTIVMTWDGRTIGGTIDPGPDAVPFKLATLDSSTWSVHIE